ncbi:LAMI_0B04236g1_1 [Lachancea mirantina]|uniref:LAMI_0B04236g1_1 n=1 Tax=Lachancea mirantina TaxID=1230905 RepID=A0A1G4IVC1_9SACH|nr:LAMI_0B04236g1_1 [Lachancea mirantina]
MSNRPRGNSDGVNHAGNALYNQVDPLTLGQSKAMRKRKIEKEKSTLLQNIITDETGSNPSGLREFILGSFQMAEQKGLDERSKAELLIQVKDLIFQAFSEKKEHINDWWSQSLPLLSPRETWPQLVCDKISLASSKSSRHSAVPPPPPPVRKAVQVPPPPPLASPRTSPLGAPNMSNIARRQDKGKRATDERELERRRKRMERFSNDSMVKKPKADDEDYANLNATSTNFYKFDKQKPVVGRCQTLEKKYLRLTSEPDPDLVRPLNVLKKSYDLVSSKYKNQEVTYSYFCDQFKSIRQDLRVQIIENKFTMKVYQTHARVALENGDIGEFNQCQSRLIHLFEIPDLKKSNLEEFLSYRVLYFLMMNSHNSINALKLKYMEAENLAIFRHPIVQHSLKMAEASLMSNYHQFFKLYCETEGPRRHLVDTFVNRERLKALDIISKSYNQLSLSFLFQQLGFTGHEMGAQFLKQHGLAQCIVTKDTSDDSAKSFFLDIKRSRGIIASQFEKAKRVDIKGQL